MSALKKPRINSEDTTMTDAETYDYDLAVIGGGSGGISCAREAAKLGAKVVLFDYVTPTIHGTSWGLGGTCVNVGCIPKKLMHYAGILGAGLHDARSLGWDFSKPEHKWQSMVETVQNHVKSLNWGYRTDMMKNKVKYIKGYARFVDSHTLSYLKKNNEEKVTAKKFVIAVGGRPVYPDIPGKELAITSDDIFSLEKPPGKTLLVGASYISLETAGFLTELGCDVTVAVRSILLRGFDQEIAEKLGGILSDIGTKFHRGVVPLSLSKTAAGIEVLFHENESGKEFKDTFDTVMFATGRRADTAGLNLENCGVEVQKNGKLEVEKEQTNVGHIYAVGDVLNQRQELTPVAIHAGLLLARRLFGGSQEQMNYELVPTTVFTPIEYGAIGLSEEDAEAKYGKDNIETYLTASTPLELAATHREGKNGVELVNPCFCKLVCVKSERDRVVGFHYVGPNAGEVTQGFALGMKLGATKHDFDSTIGIHPTSAEQFTTLRITRSSGVDFNATGC